jgi:ribosomal protein S18 acetylase RimI-like enzyme
MLIREAREADAQAIAEAHVASWQAAYRGIISDDGLASLSIPKRAAAWANDLRNPDSIVYVGEEVDRLVGFVNCWPCRDPDKKTDETGEIGGIYLHPDFWRKGFGTVLLNRALERLTQDGYSEVTLWVLEQNEVARHFYEKNGFVLDGRSEADKIRGTDVVKIRYRKPLGAKADTRS